LGVMIDGVLHPANVAVGGTVCVEPGFVASGSSIIDSAERNTPRLQGIRHTYSTLLRSVGTEFKVMQELLRHSSFRSTLDVYTQAVTPAKHAAQAAVMSLVFSSDKDGGALVAG
jgi:hypothetical protein